MGDVTCVAGTEPGMGDMIGYAGIKPGTREVTGKKAQLPRSFNSSSFNSSSFNSSDPSAAVLYPSEVDSAANCDRGDVRSDSVLDALDYQSSGSTLDGSGGSGGRLSHLALPAIMRRQLNCIKTVQIFRLSCGISPLQLWSSRSRRISTQPWERMPGLSQARRCRHYCDGSQDSPYEFMVESIPTVSLYC